MLVTVRDEVRWTDAGRSENICITCVPCVEGGGGCDLQRTAIKEPDVESEPEAQTKELGSNNGPSS